MKEKIALRFVDGKTGEDITKYCLPGLIAAKWEWDEKLQMYVNKAEETESC